MCRPREDHVIDAVDSFNNYKIAGILHELRKFIEFLPSFFRSSESYRVAKTSLSFLWCSMFYGLVHITRLHGGRVAVQSR